MFTRKLLTMLVAIYLLTLRVNAVRSRQVSIGYYRGYNGAEPPQKMQAAANHYSNLFEMPVLFYVACITSIVLNIQGTLMVGLAWAYVASRCLHTVIHLSYNNVVHRLAAFVVSNILLIVIWVILGR